MDSAEYQKIDLKRGVDYIGVTCVFICHDGKGNILMHKRSKNCRDEQGRWDCGAGAMEFGESFETAVRREIKEEYCADPISLRYVATNNVLRKHNGADTHWIAVLFAARVDPAQVKIGEPDKIDEVAWFAHNDLPNHTHSMLQEHLEMVKASGGEFLV